MRRLDDYRDVVGNEIVEEIQEKAKRLRGLRVLHINSTSDGGGVAEILNSLVPLMSSLGLEVDWKVLNGTPDFFAVTKQFHNALQGGPADHGDDAEQLYLRTNEAFSACTDIGADCVIVHDPQPLPLVACRNHSDRWVWRCHVDLSHPNEMLWGFLKPLVTQFDMAVMSSEAYMKDDLPLEQRIIFPAIDPLSPKNADLSHEEASRWVRKAGVPTDKPFITQVSRMDVWKDPEGLLDVLEHVREKVDCRLVYCYSSATDDPEGDEMLSRTYRKAGKLVDSGDVVFVEGKNQSLVNAIQRLSSVVLQKSTREGFCLCITEALWKETPVVATNVGGIPIQLKEAENGFLVDPDDAEGFADKVIELLQNPDSAERLGKRGRETVRQNFLITRLISDHLDLLEDLFRSPN
ncbi:MAG: glycosyltransferase [Dehalococcoidia bacterium]